MSGAVPVSGLGNMSGAVPVSGLGKKHEWCCTCVRPR